MLKSTYFLSASLDKLSRNMYENSQTIRVSSTFGVTLKLDLFITCARYLMHPLFNILLVVTLLMIKLCNQPSPKENPSLSSKLNLIFFFLQVILAIYLLRKSIPKTISKSSISNMIKYHGSTIVVDSSSLSSSLSLLLLLPLLIWHILSWCLCYLQWLISEPIFLPSRFGILIMRELQFLDVLVIHDLQHLITVDIQLPQSLLNDTPNLAHSH